MRILIVEDDARIAADLSAALAAAGFVPEIASDGEDAWYRGDTEEFGAVILDLGMPLMDGLSILRQWRANARTMPILILTARGTWTERVEGIEAGADDYLPKPFEMDELLARLRAIIRRNGGYAAPNISIGEITLDPRRMRVTRRGVPVQLSPQEYRLVHYMMLNPGRIIAQQELAEQLQGELFERESNAIEVLVARVRRKLGNEAIETRRGYGYMFGEETA
ncbi:MAG: response regulator transcription factor [Nitratireductor sp.]|nr:response regulator transcription factor [Nitratireductor sp.]